MSGMVLSAVKTQMTTSSPLVTASSVAAVAVGALSASTTESREGSAAQRHLDSGFNDKVVFKVTCDQSAFFGAGNDGQTFSICRPSSSQTSARGAQGEECEHSGGVSRRTPIHSTRVLEDILHIEPLSFGERNTSWFTVA